ncbi:MAG: hypothetical protein U0821_25480 [Chloroflexota bacterium]
MAVDPRAAPASRGAARQPSAALPSTLGVYASLVRLSTVVGLVAGLGGGLLALIAAGLGWPLGGRWLALTHAHGQAQLLGFVALLILAAGSLLFPRFLLSPLVDGPRLVLAGRSLALGVMLRVTGELLPPGPIRATLLASSAAFVPLGIGTALWVMARVRRRSLQPFDLWQRFGVVGFTSFGAAGLLNAWVSLDRAFGVLGSPPLLDRVVLELELWGFVVSVTLAVAIKIFPRFLILRDGHSRIFMPALGCYGAGCALVILGWLGDGWISIGIDPWVWLRGAGAFVRLLGILTFMAGLRCFEPALRESGTPHITNPTRLWIRIGYGWLVVGAVLPLAETLDPSASRHAVATGYLLPLIAAMAGRMLPVVSADAQRWRWVLPALIWPLFLGASMRVIGLVGGGYQAGTVVLVLIGGSISTIAATALLVWLLASTWRAPLRAS